MSDKWIVSGYAFLEHDSLSVAMNEAQRLAAKSGKKFRVYRIKDTLSAGKTSERIRALEQDIMFLLARADCAGSCSFTDDRWTGMSSNAIVALAYGGEQDELPSDRADYAACVRTVRRLPRHRRTPAVMAALKHARDAFLERWPSHRYPATRRAEAERWAKERASQ